MRLNAPAWLTERPIAHRGLHDAANGVIENTIGAAKAAIAAGFAIECDVQLTADGEALVFHDDTFDRLTDRRGAVAAITAAEAQEARIRGSGERPPTLREFLDAVAGRVAIVCELKSRFDGSTALADRVAALAADYDGPLALKSFDPELIAHLRARTSAVGRRAAPCPLGVVAQAAYIGPYWAHLSDRQRQECADFSHVARTQPDFLSWHVHDLPHPTPARLRAQGAPVMAWTVRAPAQRTLAYAHADQIVFEGAGRP